ncbi:MAG: ABC transporter ATP-binding protein [Candidatus Hodarchaeales archaeon]|jgi:ABC-type Fe3+/spermidine/putrescine transport system ATPase subunit
MAYIEINNLSKQFQDVLVVDSVSFSIEKGEIVGILGPSGCGKTTILKIILGLLTPDKGDIRIEGNSILDIPPEKRNFGYIPQNLALFPHLSVFNNISFGLKAKKRKKQEIVDKVNSLVKMLEIAPLIHKLPHEISGGEQQRVALARALAPDPNFLLMDEPLSSLDVSLSFHLRWEISKILKTTNTSAIYVTHNPEEAISICDRILLMNEGKIILSAPSNEVLAFPSSFKALQVLGKSNLFPIIKKTKKSSDSVSVQTSLGNVLLSNKDMEKKLLGCWVPETEILIQESNTQSDDFLQITGEVLGVIWGENKHRFIIQLSDGSQITVQLPATLKHHPKNGKMLHLLIPKEKIQWF